MQLKLFQKLGIVSKSQEHRELVLVRDFARSKNDVALGDVAGCLLMHSVAENQLSFQR